MVAAARVVSLVPSVTETLIAWGRAPIACTRFCEQPGFEHVGGTKDPEIERIVELGPDLVVVDREENRREDYEELVAAGVRVLDLHVRSVDDVEPELNRLAEAVGSPPIRIVAPSRPSDGRTVVILIWKRPWMALGRSTYGSAVVERLGFTNLVTEPGYPEIDPASIAAQRPSLVVGPSEPYPFADRHLPVLAEMGPPVLVDGRDLFWWGSRTPGAFERLAVALGA